MLNKYKEIIVYLIFGVLTTLVSIVSYSLFTKLLGINYLFSNVLSWVLAVTFAYITNKKYVFSSKNKNVTKEFLNFISVRIFSLLVEMLILYIFVDVLKINDIFAKLISQGVITVINYLFSKLFVFKKD